MEVAPFTPRGPRYPNTVVVLVSKDRNYQMKASSFIRETGYEVRETDDPFDAIRIVQYDLELNPVILITEYSISEDYNGAKLIEHLKGRKLFPLAPYMVHDKFDDEIFAKGKEAGAEVCLAKSGPNQGLGEYFRKTILGAKDYLSLQHALSLDQMTSVPEEDIYVYNQTGALAHFEYTWREARRTGRLPSIASFDLRGFSGANEEGHHDGDRLLKEVARIMCKKSKSTDCVCRAHSRGDEFHLIMPETNLNFASIACNRLNKELQLIEFKLSSGKPFRVGFRCGLAVAIRSDMDLSANDVFFKLVKEANHKERLKRVKEKSAV